MRLENQYNLLKLIGEGNAGIVWKAFDTIKKEHVAIKFVSAHS